MRILFQDVLLFGRDGRFFVATEDKKIAYVGKECPEGRFDRVIQANGKLLSPAFCNAHTHAAMTIFRGYGEDLPLSRWLEERIFPAEDRLNEEAVLLASRLAAAEMIAGGTVSFSDMYFFCDATARAVAESGMKANLSRSIVSFSDGNDYEADPRCREALNLFSEWNGACDGRILVDLSLHAEYTNRPGTVRWVAEQAARLGTRVQIHLSETEKEHRECIVRHGVTPTGFFFQNGLFEVPVSCAHGVWLTDEDRAILASHGAGVVHNPVSNLKLGSGIMPLRRTLDAGVRVALGTDGAASNNRLDILREMQTALLLQKGFSHDPASISAAEGLSLLSENGFLLQGRTDSGRIDPGFRADLCLIRTDTLNGLPDGCPETLLAYSASAADVVLTMADGRILYENGVFTTLDEEKLKYEFRQMREHYFD